MIENTTETTRARASRPLYDPLHEIAAAFGKLAKFKGHAGATHHDGDNRLISAIADGRSPHPQVHHRRNTKRHPQFPAHLQAVVFALRDAEVLIAGHAPSTCIVDSWDVP